MAQPLQTPQGKTAKLKLVKVCRECGGPLGPRNEIGVCQQTPECRKVSKRLHARGYASEAKSKHTYRNCLGCGDQLSLRNTTDYCQVKPDCQHQSDLQYARNRRAKMRAERTPAPVKLCKNCGDSIRSDNTTGYCGRKSKCRNLRAAFCYQRQAEANGEAREKRFCLDCGNLLAWNNSTDVCQSNPECRPRSRGLWQQDNRAKRAALRIRTGKQRTCLGCSEPLRIDDITGYCMAKEKCKKIHNRLYKQICADRQDRKDCEICGGWLSKGSIHGVCERTPECLTELDRRKNQAKYYRDHEGSKLKARSYYSKNKPRIRAQASQRRVEIHEPAVKPTKSRITPKQLSALVGWTLGRVYWYCKNPHPALATQSHPDGRPVQTWPDRRDRFDRKPFLCSRSDADKIIAWENKPVAGGSLTAEEVDILIVLRDSPNAMYRAAIAEAVRRSLRSTKDVCAGLVGRKLVASPKNKQKGLSLTAEGRQIAKDF